jgi:hypothetical protein
VFILFLHTGHPDTMPFAALRDAWQLVYEVRQTVFLSFLLNRSKQNGFLHGWTTPDGRAEETGNGSLAPLNSAARTDDLRRVCL